MPKKPEESKSVPVGIEAHHCSQCNRSNEHLLFEHPDGFIMQCSSCSYQFVDVRNQESESVSKVEVESESDAN